jgi:O-succinylbenzoic acid--CoA ligase
MLKRHLTTVNARDQVAVIKAMKLVISGEITLAVTPGRNSPKSELVLQAMDTESEIDAQIGLLVATSGSTSNPKAVLLSLDAIKASIAAVADELEIPGTWHLVLPLEHVAGQMTALRGLSAQSNLEAPTINAGDPMQLATYAKTIRNNAGPNYITLVPEHLNRLALINELESLKYFDRVIIGAGRVSEPTETLIKNLGLRVTRSYGLTETCGGIVWDGKPLSNVAISLSDIGEVLVSTAMNAFGYRSSPDLNLDTIHTGDLGRFQNGRLQILGRMDRKIKHKGLFVDLDELASFIQQEFSIENAVLSEDERIWVFCQSSEISELESKLIVTFGKHLLGLEIRFMDQLPRTELGKVDNWELKTDWIKK